MKVPNYAEWLCESAGHFPLDAFLRDLAAYYRRYQAKTEEYHGTTDSEGAAEWEFRRQFCAYEKTDDGRGEWLGFVVNAAKAGRASIGGQ